MPGLDVGTAFCGSMVACLAEVAFCGRVTTQVVNGFKSEGRQSVPLLASSTHGLVKSFTMILFFHVSKSRE